MTEQLNYTIYKITNTIDDKIYVGSTRLHPFRKRMNGHRSAYRKGTDWPLYEHMRSIGIEHFSIECIKEIIVPTAKHAKVQEQIEIWNHPKESLLNKNRAYSHHHEQLRNIEKKRKNRRDFYHRKKQDPVWMEAERVRNKERMKVKRQLARNGVRD